MNFHVKLAQSAFHRYGVDKSSTNLPRLGWRRGGHLCRVSDNTVWSHWQVAFRSSEVNFTKNYTLLYHFLYPLLDKNNFFYRLLYRDILSFNSADWHFYLSCSNSGLSVFFKVLLLLLLLLLLQLENGTTYSYTYNGRPIESHILNGAIFNDLEPPLPQFQGRAILWRWISHKRFDIRSFNEKLIRIYTRPILNSVISNDLEWSWVT